MAISSLEKLRLEYQPPLPEILKQIKKLEPIFSSEEKPISSEIEKHFPQSAKQKLVSFQLTSHQREFVPLKIGVVFSGGQAPGGHNVIWGLYNALKEMNPKSSLIGFLNGPKGVIDNKFLEINETILANYRNQGGFDLLGSGRDKIETLAQFKAVEDTISINKLSGLVIIGGDDSNTNAALLAEYLLEKRVPCSVVGVPKTIDGDLRNEYVDISFGFDTACKIYSEIIGNIARDAISAKKYYYFVKLMGRSASHITLECALQTQPNIALIGEEVKENKRTLKDIVTEITDVVCQRSQAGKNYGVVLIPEGIIEFIPEFKKLISDLNHILTPDSEHIKKMDGIASRRNRIAYLADYISVEAFQCLENLPDEIQDQLFMERDPHGNVQVSKIETDRLFIELVKKELEHRKQQNNISVKFNPQPIFCGYEGRSGMPSNFDCQYCFALGYVAALLLNSKLTGYMSTIQKLMSPVGDWEIRGVPLVPLIHLEQRSGKSKPVIQKAMVDLRGKAFSKFKNNRDSWKLKDNYLYPGPIQFFGPSELTDSKFF
jgi:pyrophosphate--fructose-6-phosphate 1-phosphotransferase